MGPKIKKEEDISSCTRQWGPYNFDGVVQREKTKERGGTDKEKGLHQQQSVLAGFGRVQFEKEV